MWTKSIKMIILEVLLEVADGESGRSPHITASAVSRYLWRTWELGISVDAKKLIRDINTYSKKFQNKQVKNSNKITNMPLDTRLSELPEPQEACYPS